MEPGERGSQRPSQTKCKERPSQKRARLLPCVGEGLEGSSARLVSALTARAVAGGAAGSGAHVACCYVACCRCAATSGPARPVLCRCLLLRAAACAPCCCVLLRAAAWCFVVRLIAAVCCFALLRSLPALLLCVAVSFFTQQTEERGDLQSMYRKHLKRAAGALDISKQQHLARGIHEQAAKSSYKVHAAPFKLEAAAQSTQHCITINKLQLPCSNSQQ